MADQCVCVCSDQESTQHEEADEVNDGDVAAAAELLSWFVVRLGVAAFTWKTGQHDLLPRLACSTPVDTQTHTQVKEPEHNRTSLFLRSAASLSLKAFDELRTEQSAS